MKKKVNKKLLSFPVMNNFFLKMGNTLSFFSKNSQCREKKERILIELANELLFTNELNNIRNKNLNDIETIELLCKDIEEPPSFPFLKIKEKIISSDFHLSLFLLKGIAKRHAKDISLTWIMK